MYCGDGLNHPIKKGKNFLVNDTFVRFDGVNWLNLQANVGRTKPIHIFTGRSQALIQRPIMCEGWVMKEDDNEFTRVKVHKRCMTESELNEARNDHYLLRKNRFNQQCLWLEYYHDKDSLGETR